VPGYTDVLVLMRFSVTVLLYTIALSNPKTIRLFSRIEKVTPASIRFLTSGSVCGSVV